MQFTRRHLAVTALFAAAATTAGLLTATPGAADSSHGGPTTTVIATSNMPAMMYHIPDIVRTTRGTLIASFDQRNGSGNDLPNNIYIDISRSTDDGRTWSAPRPVVEYPAPQGCGDSSMIVDRATRRIFLFCTYSAGNVGFFTSHPGSSDTTDPYTLHVQVRHSDDDGLTWSGPTDLNPQVKDPAWRGYFASSGHGLQTGTGRLIQPIAVNDAAGQTHSADIYSDDHGITWHAGSLLTAGSNESKAVELPDGTIVQNIRPTSSGYRLTAKSVDGGITFTPTQPDPYLPDPSVNADEIRVNPSAHGPRRTWLLFANAADQLARDHLTLRLSCDDGATWPVQKLIYPGPAGYVALVMLPHDRVGMIYDGGIQKDTEQVRFATIALSDLGARCG